MTSSLQKSDGSWKYTNRLAHSTSPYLLQHAHNPVNWYPWGKEALELAKKEDKPILVSIGYSTCYWCHVMERQVFCDEKIAELMNRCFINVKIDREERPDLDVIYMAARQLMTREGGWPNNVVLTPDLKPFFAGGTFAADNRYGKPSFPEVVLTLADIWATKREMALQTAEDATHYIKAQLAIEKKEYTVDSITEAMLPDRLFEQLCSYADEANGGFFHAPKFPQETYLLFLLSYYRERKDQQALDILTNSLDKMAAGGIYDHIGGGFHRYAVDEEWKVPHFEKMLYNQAMLMRCYSEAYQVTEDKHYRYVAEHILECVSNMLMKETGGFYSALDAETDEVEGAYYSWTEVEIRSLLTPKEAELFFSCFSLADIPHFAGHKHPEGGVIFVRDLDIRQGKHGKIVPLLAKLEAARRKRKLPMLDTKIITAWHSMMVATLAQAGVILQRQDYLALAEQSGHFLLAHLTAEDGRLLRVAEGDKESAIYGFLEDYAYAIQACLMLHKASHNPFWLEQAIALAEQTIQRFEDGENGGFFFSEATEESIVRIKEADDSALPSANAVMLHNMAELYDVTSNPAWHARAEHLLSIFKSDIQRSPISYCHIIEGAMRLEAVHKVAASHVLSGNIQAEFIQRPEKVISGENFTLSLKITLDEGWHMYAADEKNMHVMPLQLTFSSLIPLSVRHIEYPAAVPYQFDQETVLVYKNEVIINAELSLNAPFFTEHPAEVRLMLEWQPCDDRHCLAMERMKLAFPVLIERKKIGEK